jgi:hypothetical protein
MRHVLFLLATVGSLGLTIGDSEPGPTVQLTLPSGLQTEFVTGVLVTDKRLFEASASLTTLGTSDESLERDLRAVREALDKEIRDMKATAIALTFLAQEPAGLMAFTCFYRTLDRRPKCFRH